MMSIKNHSYSQNITNKRVAILGIYPPPFGGVSVHIRRVADQFLQQHNKVHLFNTERRLRRLFFPFYLMKLFLWLLFNRSHYVYYHSNYLKNSIADLVIISVLRPILRYKVIIVEHDCRHLYRRSSLYKRLYRWVLKRQDFKVVCIGSSTGKSYDDNGIKPHTYSIESAFLPPVRAVASIVMETYPSSLFTFLKEYTPLMLVSAAHVMLVDGKDVYGLDMCVEMLAGIKDTYPDAGLVIGLPQISNADHIALLQKRMKDVGVAEQVYILHGNKELWPLFKQVDLFVRPTLSDGDSVSVREALYFKMPVVASDICERPDDVHLFKRGDSNDFIFCVEKTLREHVYKRGA